MKDIKNYYKGKKILVTGATGFVGGWLSITLQTNCKSKVYGLGLEPNTDPSFFEALQVDKIIEKNFMVNILDKEKLGQIFNEVKPEIVFHLAAQPIVSESYKDPIETFNTNIIGTLNVLDEIKKLNTKTNCIIITSDKCYKNLEHGNPFKEADAMGGFDPYSASKAGCEIVSESFAHSFFKNSNSPNIVSARAGNIIGGGDWSKDRIVTDLVKALSSNQNISLRNPSAVRPWQHVLDVVNGYLMLGQYADKTDSSYTGYNFGPPKTHELNVHDITTSFIDSWGNSEIKIEVPENSSSFYESTILRLDSSKAHNELNWSTKLSQKDTIKWTVEWYKSFLINENVQEKTFEDIENFFSL